MSVLDCIKVYSLVRGRNREQVWTRCIHLSVYIQVQRLTATLLWFIEASVGGIWFFSIQDFCQWLLEVDVITGEKKIEVPLRKRDKNLIFIVDVVDNLRHLLPLKPFVAAGNNSTCHFFIKILSGCGFSDVKIICFSVLHGRMLNIFGFLTFCQRKRNM